MEAFLLVKTAHVEVEEMVIYSCEAETALFILFKHFCVSNDKVCMTRLAPLSTCKQSYVVLVGNANEPQIYSK